MNNRFSMWWLRHVAFTKKGMRRRWVPLVFCSVCAMPHFKVSICKRCAIWEHRAGDFAESTAARIQGRPGGSLRDRIKPPGPRPTIRSNLKWLWWGLYGRWKRGELPHPGRCSGCGRVCLLYYTPSLRMDDPSPFFSCCKCNQSYIEQMESQWADYHRGCL